MHQPRRLILPVLIAALIAALAFVALRGGRARPLAPVGGPGTSEASRPPDPGPGREPGPEAASPSPVAAEGSEGAARTALGSLDEPQRVDLRVRLVALAPALDRVRPLPDASRLGSVAGCSVELRALGPAATGEGDRTRSSDESGIVQFEDLPVGTYELGVSACAGQRAWRGIVDLARPRGGLRRLGRLALLEIRLWPEQGRLAGRLVDADGRPVAGARLALVSGKDVLSRRGSGADLMLGFSEPTRADGSFELPRCEGVEPQEVLVCAGRADLPALWVRRLSASELDGTTPLVPVLPRARLARLSVLDADGLAAPGRLCLQRDGAMLPADCEERLEHLPGLDRRRGVRRGPGTLELPLAAGHYVVHFLPEDPSRSRSLFSFELKESGPAAFEFGLEP